MVGSYKKKKLHGNVGWVVLKALTVNVLVLHLINCNWYYYPKEQTEIN